MSLTLLDQNGQEISVLTDTNDPIEILIPRDPNLSISPFTLQDVLSASSNNSEIFNLHFIKYSDSTNLPVSIHLELRPLNLALAYWLVYRYDTAPQVNTLMKNIDGWTLLCPISMYFFNYQCLTFFKFYLDLTNEQFFRYYIDNEQTLNHQSIIFGIRELDGTEYTEFCLNATIPNDLPSIFNSSMNFTENYEIRTYTSGCLYLDDKNNWRSDGLKV